MLDLTKTKFTVKNAMRYDTPGDYFFKDGLWQFEAWSGLSRTEYIQEVFGHELQEAMIITAAGITQDQIDTIDNFRHAVWSYARRYKRALIHDAVADPEEMGLMARIYEEIPKKLRDLYDQAHFQAILWGRTFIDACGLDWEAYEQEIIDCQGKIPLRSGIKYKCKWCHVTFETSAVFMDHFRRFHSRDDVRVDWRVDSEVLKQAVMILEGP